MLIVTGSNLRAEKADRPLAYWIQSALSQGCEDQGHECNILVISDLWYLGCQILHCRPMISVGGPSVNAVSAHLSKHIGHALLVDNALQIQMDPTLRDLRVCVWGANNQLTINAVDLFINNGYLERFIEASLARFAE